MGDTICSDTGHSNENVGADPTQPDTKIYLTRFSFHTLLIQGPHNRNFVVIDFFRKTCTKLGNVNRTGR